MRTSWGTDSEVWPVSDWGQAGPEQWSASEVGTWWWHPPPRDPATCDKCSPTQRSHPQQTSSGRSASYSNHEMEVGETAINDCCLFVSTRNASSATKRKWTSNDQLHVFWKTASVFSLPVKGSGLPNKVNLEVVGDFHRCSNTAPQLDGNFIAIVFKHKLLRKSSIMSHQFQWAEFYCLKCLKVKTLHCLGGVPVYWITSKDTRW